MITRDIELVITAEEEKAAKEKLNELVSRIIQSIHFSKPLRGEGVRQRAMRHGIEIKSAINQIPFVDKALVATLAPKSQEPIMARIGAQIICELAHKVIFEALVEKLQ